MKFHLPELRKFNENVRKNIEKSLQEPYDDGYKHKILTLLKENPQTLTDSFYKELGFGTGGIRGLMGVGTNRLNEYTIEKATQGLANYILKQPLKRSHHRVFISYDNRKNSESFAKITARVLAANDIEAYLVKNLRPTPICSFGIIHFHCIAGIMITASHNPPDYNGYKVYWEDGAQILPPHETKIISEIKTINDLSQIKIVGKKHPLIHFVGESLDKIYIQVMRLLQNHPENNKKNGHKLKIVYTNLHGTGITMIPQLLRDWGFSSIEYVKEQLATDPHFSKALKPNPEEKQALELGVKVLIDKGADLLLATDPDADRVAVVVPHKQKALAFSGNQIACMCAYHLLESKKDLPENSAFVKTIVTTELFREIVESYGKTCFDVLTGFKYIGEKIREFEKDHNYRFIFGAEESLGYLLGSYVRDKDAITASALICEMALYAKKQKLSLFGLLKKIYTKFGVFRDKLHSISFPEGEKSMQKMNQLMSNLRKYPPKKIANLKIVKIEDYEKGKAWEVSSQKEKKLTLPQSNVLLFWLEDHSKLVIRPSGTEPKIKIYASVQQKEFSSVEAAMKACDQRLKELISNFETIFK